jgi:hypothetical protein
VKAGDGIIGIGGVGIGLLVGSFAHFLFIPTVILVASVVLNHQYPIQHSQQIFHPRLIK